ncbi:MAG: glycosyltransferase family 2 protein [Nitrososphaerota archaeon]|jgi:hyaluronan synthase|nr:glycosyltransferase family 2 protein [Nitrososphaerota archaeon]
MYRVNKMGILCVANVCFAVTILALLYVYRMSVFEFQWMYWIVAIYGTVVTSLAIFRLLSAYIYKPVPDRNYRPKVSVIIPVYNEGKIVGATIDAILNSDYPKDKLELVVVDDKSTDNSLEVINKKCLEHNFKVTTHVKNMGKRHAMATGVKYCTGEILVCVDSDTIVKPDAIKLLIQPFVDEQVFCVSGNAAVFNGFDPEIDTFVSRFQKVWYAESFRVRKGIESLLGMVLCCSGVLSAYRKEKFEQATDEWLNERFFGKKIVSGDDRQMTNLMMRMGGKSVFQANALAYTIAPHTLKKFLVQQLRWGRSGIRGMLYASKFFHKKKIMQRFLFYLTALTMIVSPFTLMVSIVGLALFGGTTGFISYFCGIVVIALVFALTDKLLISYFTAKDVLYRIALFALMIPVAFVYLYGWLTPWRGTTWGTR